MAKLLLAENQRATRIDFFDIFESEKYFITIAESADECKRLLLKNVYDIVVYNTHMPTMSGPEFLNFVQNKGIVTPVIISMPEDKKDLDMIVKCVRDGAVGFIEKPYKPSETLATIKSALHNAITQNESKRKTDKKVVKGIPEIIGNSPQIVAIKKMIQRVSRSDARVVITGSNGTGKELVARWLHELSERKMSQLVEVNCAAIPNELIESELFGHEKGSFTSASSQHIGKFELANNGTLFLDEIGDMSLSAQAKVLRVLQENKISRVGATKDMRVDVRVIAATNKDLKEEIRKGLFREDLYHRLNVIHIHVPSLAERSEDIPLLVNNFIIEACRRRSEPPREITTEAMLLLQNKPWTGNIRELQNIVERLVILCEDKIEPKDIDEHCSN